MVPQINPIGSPATEVASAPPVVTKPPLRLEPVRPAVADTTANRVVGGRFRENTKKELDSAVQKVGDHLKESGSELEIQYDKTSGRNVFKIVDAGTGGVVLQIPSEEVLAMARKLRATPSVRDTSGVLVDKEG